MSRRTTFGVHVPIKIHFPLQLTIMYLYRLIAIVALCLLCSCATESDQAEAETDVKDIKALLKKDGGASDNKDTGVSEADKQQAMSNYLVPSPGEILSALDKLDRVSWNELASYNQNGSYDNKYARSLNLGVRVADSFVAINAEDAENFGYMSSLVFELGEDLGIKRVLTEKREDLNELARRGAWSDMRAELDNIQGEIQGQIEAIGEEDLVVLAGIGGWLEGLRVVSAHLKDNYSEDHSELLNQGSLIQYYTDELGKLGSDASAHPLVKSISDGLGEIQAVIPVGETNKVAMEHVQTLNQVSTRIIEAIEQG
ncbi:MAG: hypothetical protein AAF399_09870 [Bacteroidota bacterium]